AREKEAIRENRGKKSWVSTLQVPETPFQQPKVGDVSFPCPQNARSRQPRISMRPSGRVRIVLEGPDQGAKGIDTRNGEPNHATQSLSHVRGRHVYRTR